MTHDQLGTHAEQYLRQLCVDIGSRPLGSPVNRQATALVAQALSRLGWRTECPAFRCLYWTQEGATLTVGDEAFGGQVSPYSLGCQLVAPLTAACTVEALETMDARNTILLLHGEIAREQLMPKRFPFYNPESHQRIVRLLEAQAPAAIIAATRRNPELAGALYPFPLIEDGDFDIPSVYTTEEKGGRLVRHTGKPIRLEIRSRRVPAEGCNVIAMRGASEHRLVFCAHIDGKVGTPAALDNATGVVVLLLLAELLSDHAGPLGVELVALNGEDDYAASGEIQYLQRNEGRLHEIMLAVNMDGAGYHRGCTAYSLYACSAVLASTVRRVLAAHDGLVEGSPWYQSDHMIFVQHGVPALAVTSERFAELSASITHTPADRPERVDCARLVQLALALRDLVGALGSAPG